MNMHWVTARVNLSGQNFYVYHYLDHEPISWPEAQVMMALHGEENVYEVKPCRVGDSAPTAEKNRLLSKYAREVVEQVFPGRSPRMEMCMPGHTEDQPRADEFGQPLVEGASVPINGDDEPDEPVKEPPIAPAVFSPGRQRPAPGA